MKKRVIYIFIFLVFILLIVGGILLGMPKKEENMKFDYQEPILYLKSHANLSNNTDFSILNENYLSILSRNGLSEDDIISFDVDYYKQNDNVYSALFNTKYGDSYLIYFNLDNNSIMIKRNNDVF